MMYCTSFVLHQLLLGSIVEADNGVGHNLDSGCTPYPFPQCLTDGLSGKGGGGFGGWVWGVWSLLEVVYAFFVTHL